MNKKGFTLIELLVYIALIAIILVASIDFMWSILNAKTKSNVTQETQQISRLALDRIIYEIRGAEDVIKSGGQSVFGTNPGKLTLQYSAGNVIIDTATKSVVSAGQNVTIHQLRITAGGGEPVEITAESVDVANFVLTDLTVGNEPDSIKIDLTLTKVNPNNDAERRATTTLQTTVSLRR